MDNILDRRAHLQEQHKANKSHGGGSRPNWHDDVFHQTKSGQPEHKQSWHYLFACGWTEIDGQPNPHYDPKVGLRVIPRDRNTGEHLPRVDENGLVWDFSKTKMTHEIANREIIDKGLKNLSISTDGVCEAVYQEIRAKMYAQQAIDPQWKSPESLMMSKRSDLDFELLKALFPDVKGVAKKEVSKTEAQVR